MVALETFRNQMKVIVPMKDQEVLYYKNFVDFLVKYEEVSMKPSQEQDPNVSTTLLYGVWGDELKSKLTKTVSDHLFLFLQAENIKNPFKTMRNWVKSELMEL